MTMRSEPRHGRALDKARRDTRHFSVGVYSGPRPLHLRRDVGWRARRCRASGYLNLFRNPFPVVPLPYEAAPILNHQLDSSVANAESGFLIAGRRRQQIYPVVFSGRERDRLSGGNQRIGLARRRQTKTNTCIHNLAWQHFGRQRLSLRRVLVVRKSIETAIARSSI